MTTVEFVVPDDLDGVRADKVLALMLAVPRSVAREIIDSGDAVADDAILRAAQRVAAGTTIIATEPPPEPDLAPDSEVSFGVVYEDDHVAVIDKPAGLVVHPGSGRGSATLVHGLMARYPEIVGVGEQDRWGIVHRLDRDTSGLLIVARTPGSYDVLVAMMKAREVSRRYLSVVRNSFTNTIGTIEAPIGRDPSNPTRMRIAPLGRPARTHYRRLAEWTRQDTTLLSVSLDTGRMHQIRVHLRSIGHPVVGDRMYGKHSVPGDPGRPWLHARQLALHHPVSGRAMNLVCHLPIDLSDSLVLLGPADDGPLVDINGDLL